MKKIITLSFLLILVTMNSQQKQLPFFEIGSYSSDYSPTNIVSRMIEGLGYTLMFPLTFTSTIAVLF